MLNHPSGYPLLNLYHTIKSVTLYRFKMALNLKRFKDNILLERFELWRVRRYGCGRKNYQILWIWSLELQKKLKTVLQNEPCQLFLGYDSTISTKGKTTRQWPYTIIRGNREINLISDRRVMPIVLVSWPSYPHWPYGGLQYRPYHIHHETKSQGNLDRQQIFNLQVLKYLTVR